jgi:hypothetical protein
MVLGALGWTPKTDAEKVHFLVARRDGPALAKIMPLARRTLLADLEGNDPVRARCAAYALIGLGDEESLDELVAALDRRPDAALGGAYLACERAELVDSAAAWAKGRNLALEPSTLKPALWRELMGRSPARGEPERAD